MRKIEIGTVIPEFIGHNEGTVFDITDDGAILRIFYDDPTPEELYQLAAGMPFEMKTLELKDVLYILVKFGSLCWMDCPYNVNLSLHLTKITYIRNAKRLPLLVSVINGKNGKIEYMRLIDLNEHIIKQINNAMQSQLQKPFNRTEYGRHIAEAYSLYSSAKMAKIASYGLRNPQNCALQYVFDGTPAVRESVKWLWDCGLAQKGTYSGLPEELQPYHYWLIDSGNVVMAIPECLLEQAIQSGNLMNYECGIPCSYVLRQGYRFYCGYVVVDAPYNSETGLQVEEEDW